VFDGQTELRGLRRRADRVFCEIDLLVVPTVPTTYRIAEVEADPLALNNNLAHYTNFVNLLGLAAVAVPTGFTESGAPHGVTLIGPAMSDGLLAGVARRLHGAAGLRMGATAVPVPAPQPRPRDESGVAVAVLGAHMTGMPLNHQLTGLGAVLESRAATAPLYRLYDLPGFDPARPGLLRVSAGGGSIMTEVWRVPTDRLGALIETIAPPLGLGTVVLASGREVHGFLCEVHATLDAMDITEFGGWRAHWEATAGSVATPRA
jgi:allophanate hydrolase